MTFPGISFIEIEVLLNRISYFFVTSFKGSISLLNESSKMAIR